MQLEKNDSKKCTGCGLTKPVFEFYKRRDLKDGYRRDCKKCNNLRRQKYLENHREKERYRVNEWHILKPNKSRNIRLKTMYGITLEDYHTMLLVQEGKCKICKKFETAISDATNKIKTLAVDHDHITGKVRGLLCDSCNVGLGRFKDSVDFLKQAILYLESYK